MQSHRCWIDRACMDEDCFDSQASPWRASWLQSAGKNWGATERGKLKIDDIDIKIFGSIKVIFIFQMGVAKKTRKFAQVH